MCSLRKLKCWPEELTHRDVLDGVLTGRWQRRLRLKNYADLNSSGDRLELALSECQTSLILTKDDGSKSTFRFVCSACKDSYPFDLQSTFGCARNKYHVCEDCHKNFGFTECDEGHQFVLDAEVRRLGAYVDFGCKHGCGGFSGMACIRPHELRCRFNEEISQLIVDRFGEDRAETIVDYGLLKYVNGTYVFDVLGYPVVAVISDEDDGTKRIETRPCNVDRCPHEIVAMIKENEGKFRICKAESFCVKASEANNNSIKFTLI